MCVCPQDPGARRALAGQDGLFSGRNELSCVQARKRGITGLNLNTLVVLVLAAVVVAALLAQYTGLSFNVAMGIMALAAMVYWLFTLVDED